jgi:Pyridoxamine 5'-phosphate oxidase
MVTWATFEAAAPDLAADGRRLIHARGDGEALLATVRGDDPPRIHPVNVEIVDGRLYAFIIARSAKLHDLERDGRYALHTHVDPAAPSEFAVRGRAHPVEVPDVRSAVAAVWSFDADDGYRLFEFSIESALGGTRDSADDWPPRYVSWSSASAPVA